MFRFEVLTSSRLLLKPTLDEEAYREAMKKSHLQLEPEIYPPFLDFRFHPGKVLIDLFLQGTDAFVGGLSLHDWTEDSCELGYWLLPEYQGQGYMIEGGEVVIEELFRQDFKRVKLVCDIRNYRSITLAKRLGFQHEGYLSGLDPVTEKSVTKLLFTCYPP